MAKLKKVWTDRVVQNPHQYKDQFNNVLILTEDAGTITDAGTPIVASAMNDLEMATYLSCNTFTNSSGTDSYVITITGLTSLTQLIGIPLKFSTTVANTGACTLNPTSLGAIPITKDVSVALETGDILANSIVMVVYDGTQFQIMEMNGIVTKNGTQTITNKTFTAPKLASGGFIADANGNELIKASAVVASAVNEITVTNAIAGQPPRIEASGGDANANLLVDGKGTGRLVDKNNANYIREGTDILTPMSTVLSALMKSSYELAHYQVSSPVTGTMKITLPSVPVNATMIALKVTGYNYETVSSMWELNLSAYAYVPALFQSTSATLIGDAPFTSVRFAVDGAGKHCILLGGLTTSWQYPIISLSQVMTGYNGWALSNLGYTITLLASESGIVVSETPILKKFTTKFIRQLTGDVANSSTVSWQGLTEINIPLVAGKKYKVSGMVRWTTTLANNHFCSLYLPTGSASFLGVSRGMASNGSYNVTEQTSIGVAGVLSTGSFAYPFEFDGVLTCLTNATISLAIKPQAGATTMTAKVGSYLIVEEVV